MDTEKNTQVNTQDKKNNQSRKSIVRGLIVAAAIVAVILIAVRIRSISKGPSKTEAAETRLQLDALAEQDMTALQEEIDLRRSVIGAAANDAGDEEGEEESEAEPEEAVVRSETGRITFTDTEMPSLEVLKGYNYREIFSNCVVMGDSIAYQLETYEILNSAEVVAADGASIYESNGLLETAAALNPKIAFLTFGLNDMIMFDSDLEGFEAAYDEFLTQAQELMPNTEFYVVLILPVSEEGLERRPSLKYRDEYNLVITSLCEAHGIPYMNLDFTMLNGYYDQDGIQPVADFYYGWLYYMAKGAGLIS